MQHLSKEEFNENLENVRGKIERACEKARREVSSIRLMAVTKNHSGKYVEAALACNQSLFGENRVQEASAKFEAYAEQCELHLIGHLQRNKAQIAARTFSCIESIDKIETLNALESALEKLDKHMGVLIEVNTSGEPAKSGVTNLTEYYTLLDNALDFKYISFQGLMTVGPLSNDEIGIRKAFSLLRKFFEDTRSRYPGIGCEVLSMGMSSDYTLAIEEGSNLVRLGTALFGKRE